MKTLVTFFLFLGLSLILKAQSLSADSAWIVTNYVKWEKMVPMRDGSKLFTAIYMPKDSLTKHPILLTRTPYSCAPYGADQFRAIWNTNHGIYSKEKYIIVFQDVRGRFMSEGQFMDVRPFNPNKKGTETDEASDTYDTVEWLLGQLPGNNGNVGVFGISYPGFYSSMAALSGHPAIKAVSPQAPVTDWFIGDDFHHNGAFMLFDAFDFYSGFGVPRPKPVTQYNAGYQRKEPDAYKFFLNAGALSNFNKQFLGDSILFWNDLMHQPVYNNWWQSRNVRTYAQYMKPPTLIVGGTFDAEDCFGAWNLYKAIESGKPSSHYNKIVMGPWFHGAWGGRSLGDSLGSVRFGSHTSLWYQEHVEKPFFEQLLEEKKESADIPEATVFFTGSNTWKQFNQWPPASVKEKTIYLQSGGKMAFEHPAPLRPTQRPDSSLSYTQYISDPATPVPHEGTDTIKDRTREYMSADQRFASKRSDVITFRTTAFSEDFTLAGPVLADLMVSISGTDADFIVKIIDEFPDSVSYTTSGADTVYQNKPDMNGYQMLVRGEVMRGKFRNNFELPEPFVPNKITKLRFELPDVAHTFLKGHKLVVQIQSSWFPLVDRNPQHYLDIYQAKDSDFQKASIRIFHTEGVNSKIILPVLLP